ncbi:hypothetical protein [Longimicrobium terrae]|uniref:Uncharacterized protein n=1 Tax=Longimicrobium terrae TaxID=1639882 RepID=A0A841H5H1_9BACT|nr:hypothetical protein [Longimicrobium terrae]MBB4638943.1 hypothetical protein [Longimicrobium terrae]MBB6073182.1 hypothetical protein [Longimicrobium terrae]NNC32363.1 hypothetical protein [Longimicrobium terrae]
MYLAARPGFGWRLLYGFAHEVTWISGLIAAVLLGSWWPLIAGFVIGAFGWHWLLLWLTPLSVVTPAESARARRGWWLTIFWFAVAVILVGLIAGP